MHALDSCRIEKAFRHFGHDITDEDHVLEAGLSFAMKTRKGDFIGRDGVLARREAGLDRRLVQFRLSDPEPLLFHNEAVVRVTCQRRSLLALCGKRLRPVSISGT